MKTSIRAKKKLKNANFFLEVLCLMELDEGKIINCVPDRILHSRPKPFLQRYCVTKISVSKFGIDTIKNRWYRIGIVSVSYRYRIDLKKLVSPIPNYRAVARTLIGGVVYSYIQVLPD